MNNCDDSLLGESCDFEDINEDLQMNIIDKSYIYKTSRPENPES